MGLESILALAALLVAIYAIVPRDRRLGMVLKLNLIDWFLIIVSLVVVHYLQFYNFFRSFNLTPQLGLSKWGVTPKNATYIVILITVLILYLRLRFAKLSKGKVFKFRELTGELLRTGQQLDLISLLENHLKSLVRIYRNDFFLPKVRERLNPPIEVIIRNFQKNENGSLLKKKKSKIKVGLKNWVSSKIPGYSKETEAAQDIIRQLLLSEDFVNSVAKNRPYFALKLINQPFHEQFDFLNLYVTALLSNTSSILYYEIQNNQNISSFHRYHLYESNKFLHFLFKDTKVAKKLSVWKPFGDYSLSFLDSQTRNPSQHEYNQDMGDYYENGKWKCPIFITIIFFDIMVSEALYQNVQWHMWLYYFPLLVERIERNYSPQGPLVRKISEWPTQYSYLLYHVVSTMCGWVRALRDIPSTQENVVLNSQDTENENGNIPKSTILALCRCFRFILSSKNISAEFKNYLLDSLFSLYFDIRVLEDYKGYAEVLKNALIQGGEYYMGKNRKDYIEQIVIAFNSFDSIPYNHEHVKEFRDFLAHNLALSADC